MPFAPELKTLVVSRVWDFLSRLFSKKGIHHISRESIDVAVPYHFQSVHKSSFNIRHSYWPIEQVLRPIFVQNGQPLHILCQNVRGRVINEKIKCSSDSSVIFKKNFEI